MEKKKTNAILAAGVAVSLAAAGAAAYKNADYIFAERVRQLFKKNDEVRDSGLTEPDDVVKVRDIAYVEDDADFEDASAHLMDIYYPVGTGAGIGTGADTKTNAKTGKPLPTIVSVHGGGFVYGDKDLYRFYCMSLAQRGFAVVNFSYRLAPKYRFPAQLEDTNAVMHFICDHAQEYFIDPDNVFLVGDSAGAQMASQYCAAATNPEYADLLGWEIPPVRIRACALNCGLYEIDPKKDRMMGRCYFGGSVGDYAEVMDVCENITENFPPAFVMSANGDFLLDRAKPFAELLTQRGVENELHIYGDDDHKLGHVFHCNMKEPMAHQCNDDECAFFLRHCRAE